MYWGRLPGTEYDREIMQLMTDGFEDLGLSTERVAYTIPSDWTSSY